MSAASPDFPPRLIEGDGRHAELLRRALAEAPLAPTEQQSWQRLSARAVRSSPRWLLPALAVALALMSVLAWLRRR